MEIFLAIEWEGNSLGHIIGVYSKIEAVCEEVKRYLDSPVLFIDGELASYADVDLALSENSHTVFVQSEGSGFSAILFKMTLDSPHP